MLELVLITRNRLHIPADAATAAAGVDNSCRNFVAPSAIRWRAPIGYVNGRRNFCRLPVFTWYFTLPNLYGASE
jgi:hypothetical protein